MSALRLPTKSLRTAVQFSKFLLDELGWRRKELSYFKTQVAKEKTSGAFARAAIALLYAHWEGFIKISSSAYIEHVRQQGRTVADLKSNFIALSARSIAENARQSSRWKFQVEFCDYVRGAGQQLARWPKSFAVDTGSNLTAREFRDVVCLIGIQYRSEFQTAEKPIIERLLELRNGIAHGDSQIVDVSEYHQLHDKIDVLLGLFCNELDNAAATESYRVLVTPT